MAINTTVMDFHQGRMYRQSITCKCCPRPLAPHQQDTGICDPCQRKLAGISEGRPDWEFVCNDVPGFGG